MSRSSSLPTRGSRHNGAPGTVRRCDTVIRWKDLRGDGLEGDKLGRVVTGEELARKSDSQNYNQEEK